MAHNTHHYERSRRYHHLRMISTYRAIHPHLFFFWFSDVREISTLAWTLVFEYISLETSNTKRSERSERASLHPPSILTYGPPTEVGAPAGACFHSYGGGWRLFCTSCSRDFNRMYVREISIVCSRYFIIHGISIWIYISLETSMAKRSERASLHPPSILTYGSFLRRLHLHLFSLSFQMFERFQFTCSRDFILLWY